MMFQSNFLEDGTDV